MEQRRLDLDLVGDQIVEIFHAFKNIGVQHRLRKTFRDRSKSPSAQACKQGLSQLGAGQNSWFPALWTTRATVGSPSCPQDGERSLPFTKKFVLHPSQFAAKFKFQGLTPRTYEPKRAGKPFVPRLVRRLFAPYPFLPSVCALPIAKWRWNSMRLFREKPVVSIELFRLSTTRGRGCTGNR
jgi:hypothetical protein